MQRVLESDEDCSCSSDESFIGQSGVLAISSSDEDHSVVLAPLEVGDLLAGLARAIGSHTIDARMDILVQKAIRSRRQRRKRSNILRTRMQESRISDEPETYVDPESKNWNVETKTTPPSSSMMRWPQRAYESFHRLPA